LTAAAMVAALALLLTACGLRPDGPAPVVSGEATAAAPVEPESVQVRAGQTLSGIAHIYHVPMPVIAEANHLTPPYRIEVGRTLIIPQAGQPPVPLTSTQGPGAPPPKPEEVAALPRPTAGSLAVAPPPPAASMPTAAAEPLRPDVKPAAVPPGSAEEPPAATLPPQTSAPDSRTFLWPVRGHVLNAYGSGGDGTHNDGINIAAPRGAAVEAANGGVVAYAGNELRGYGNLILVKHPNGWISAYGHCDQILVKRGDKVARGQTIARVGSTGNVAEPQLHFELRHGNRAVDPREFLAPLPTAGAETKLSPELTLGSMMRLFGGANSPAIAL
jgi:murein DD-endopeptidase MepM/ murein hydrolase activator NlpD